MKKAPYYFAAYRFGVLILYTPIGAYSFDR